MIANRTLIFLVLLLSGFAATAQTGGSAFAPDTAVNKLFERPDGLNWVRFFAGRLDDVSDVAISLGFDGKNLRGFLTYPSTRTRLRLDGTLLDEHNVELRELNGNGETTGRISATLAEGRLEGDWTNGTSNIGATLACEQVNVSQPNISHCADNKWLNRYASQRGGGRFELLLLRANNGQLSGSAWLETTGETLILKGDLAKNGDFVLAATRRDGTERGRMLGSLRFLQHLELTWLPPDGGSEVFKFYLKENLALGCYNSADFASSYGVLYPKTTRELPDKWFERQVANWVNNFKAAVTARSPDTKPARRASIRASAWPEVSLWTDDLLSGVLTFTESWKPDAHGAAFNFDLKNNREITPNSLFIKNFDSKKWLAEQVQKQLPNLPLYANAEAKTWLEKDGFQLMTIRREGLALSTSFHPVFGQQSIVLGWAELKQFLQPNGPLAGLVK